ncbi:MAG: hypothetical protein M3Q16_09905 [Pseudomonadota bacterium]|nr:hypothetical protein [Pseudomonadota bacterium]
MPLPFQFYGEINRGPQSEIAGESIFKALEGSYDLYMDYVFISQGDIKVTTRDGKWEANSCVKGRDKGSYVLRGADSSTHEVEVIINDKYEHVATTVTNYSSEVVIDRNGQPMRRTVHYQGRQPDPEPIPIDFGRERLKDKEDYISKKIAEYKNFETKSI